MNERHMSNLRSYLPARRAQGAAVSLWLAALMASALMASAPASAQVAIDDDDIGGVVRSSTGPEAGVWVIAETTDLPTKFTRTVVTDDQGRYVLPDMPSANYQVWVRGYGLVDSAKVIARPGQQLNLAAVIAPDEAAAAEYYPAVYWYSMLKMPPADHFGEDNEHGLPPNKTRADYQRTVMRSRGCINCHQLGNKATRTIHPFYMEDAEGNHEDGWIARLQTGHNGERMTGMFAADWNGVPYKYFANWTDGIAKGQFPKTKPPRPTGEERNVVTTSWEWSMPNKFMHDQISTDKRDPTVNAYGKIYGSSELSMDMIPVLDPKTHRTSFIYQPVRDADTEVALGPNKLGTLLPSATSAYWGDEIRWNSRANNHNSMFDERGRVWSTSAIRNRPNADFCSEGSDHPSAKVFPVEDQYSRQAVVYDPESGKFDFIDTCFATHHLQFGYDEDNTLWFSGSGPVAGWLNTREFDETGDAIAAQGWAPFVLDTNGNGKLDNDWAEPGKPEAGKDQRIGPAGGAYAVMPHTTDGSVWYTQGVLRGPAGFMRFDPATKLTEFYHVPAEGGGVRGGDIDKNGVLWGSGYNGSLVSFDRTKCEGPLNGPLATGDHCPEGFTFHRYPGPAFEGEESEASAESSYYTQVDHHNAVGLGENVPISTANLNEGFVAYKDGKMLMMRIPYPMGFYAKGFDGRIDDPNIGWKGRGLWSTSGDRTPWLMETGLGSHPRAVHIQIRPDPLAK